MLDKDKPMAHPPTIAEDVHLFTANRQYYLIVCNFTANDSAVFSDCQNCDVLIAVNPGPLADSVNAERITVSLVEANVTSASTARGREVTSSTSGVSDAPAFTDPNTGRNSF